MISEEELLRLHPAVKVAMTIGEQSGIPLKMIQDWYGEVLLGELELGVFLKRIRSRVRDPGLMSSFDAVVRSLPHVGETPSSQQ